MLESSPQCEIWKKLADSARETAGVNDTPLCPTVIHFARFEIPFLDNLHRKCAPDTDFPFEIICTHEIVKPPMAEIPRKGIRAVAGYFGHSVPEERRSHHHVTATVIIWSHAVRLLEKSPGISTLDELFSWLAETEAPAHAVRTYPLARQVRSGLPDEPGVYRMQRSNGDTLYVGKAKSLKHRVESYFQKSRRHPEHILEMLTQVQDIDITVTGSAVEAALLESDEVKRLSPPYNKALRRRNRQPGFFSRDFSGVSRHPDENFPIGPLPDQESLFPLARISELITSGPEGEIDTKTSTAVLGIPQEYAPDTDCFREGFQMFVDEHGGKSDTGLVPTTLRSLGRTLWQKRLIELSEAEAETMIEDEKIDNADGEEDVIEEWIWTPDVVARSLEGVIRRSTYLIRRASWLCLLSESTIVWEARDPEQEKVRRNFLIFQGGKICDQGTLAPRQRIPLPPGHDRPFRDRQKSFDLVTYDRLRVMSTELRRLISERKKPRIRLGPHTTLGVKQIEKALRWV